MAWATCYILNPKVCGPGADGNAIVAGLYAGGHDGDSHRLLDVDPICVGAVTGSDDLHPLHIHIIATIDHKMIQLAVFQC